MATQQYVDGVLLHYGERLLWDEQPKSKTSKGDNELSKIGRVAGRSLAGSGVTADAVRSHVQALVRRSPQVMVKVTGGGGDMKRIGAHIDYIARGGRYKKKSEEELELETEAGEVLRGKEARQQLRDEWEMGGAPIPKEIQARPNDDEAKPRARREALNLILSMPPGVDRELVKAAARETVKELFGANHQYVMAHHDDTDKQHAHVCVKMVGRDGRRLNPRKADLEKWRILFAKNLNRRGVDAVASRRRVRMQRAKGDKQAVHQMKARGASPKNLATAQTQAKAAERARQNEGAMVEAYQHISDALAQSPDKAQRDLSAALQTRLAQDGIRLQKPPQPSVATPTVGR